VTTNHGPFNDELGDIYRRIARRVPIISISHAQHKPVPDIPIARVIHHGIDGSQYPFKKEGGDYCLFLGRMSPEKGANRAKDAAVKAGVPLLMAAKMREPWEHEYYEENVEPYLSDEVQYVGEVSHDRKLELLSNAKCLLFPIRWNEPFGMVMIEAMACGTPVLAFSEGAAPEVVEDGKTGFMCRDESDMAEAISRVDQIDRQACRDAVEGYFSVKRMVDEHLDLFAQILNC
jgi:glycosyltransferase involved in cell wall biosynthesis